MSRLLPLLPLTLSALVAAASEAPALPDHPLTGQSDGMLLVDLTRTIAGAAEAKPSSLWSDPDFATQRAYIEQQLEILFRSEPEAPPLLEVLRHGKRFYTAVSIPEPTPGLDFGFPLLLALDLGEAAPALETWWERELAIDGEAATVAGITGIHSDDGLFTAVLDQVLVVGRDQLVEAWHAAGRLVPAPQDAVAVSHTDFGKLMTAMGQVADLHRGSAMFMDLCFGQGWRESRPSITTHSWVDAQQGWQKLVQLLVGVFTAQQDPEQELDPEAAKAELDRLLHEQAGFGLDRIAATLTGQVALSFAWATDAMPIPKGVVVIGINDGDTAAAVASQLLQQVDPQAAEVAGAHMAWNLAVPMQQLTVAVGPDALVISNRPDLAASALAGRADAVAPWDHDEVTHLDLALHAIGERWLPMGLAQLAMLDEPLGSDPMSGLRNARWQIGHNLQTDPPPASVAAAFFADDNQAQDWVRNNLRKLFAVDEDLEQVLEQRVAIWQSTAEPGFEGMPPEVALVLRTADGYRLVKDWNEVISVADAAAARAQLEGHERKLGPSLEDLLPVVLPEPARFDRHWLPSAPLAIRHLPQHYTIAVRQAAGAWTIEEQGLPLLGTYAHSAGILAAAAAPVIGWQLQNLERQAQQGRLRTRHQAMVAVLELAAPAIEQLHMNGVLPPKASHLVTGGHLSLEDTAPLFGGQVPSAAANLDLVGRWTPEPEDWPQAVWAIHLEPGWAAYVSPWGEVHVSNELPEIPVPPENAATAAAGDDADF